MASSRRREAVSPTPSHFFKVILAATLKDKKLSIPEKFVRKFGDELSDVATMRGPNGRVWHVKLIKDGKKIWFHDGWHDFVEYHSIGHGHFLLFKYEKNSDFQVVIFDESACEVEYPGNCEEVENDEQNSLQQDETRICNSVDQSGLETPNLHLSSLRRATRCVECSASLESKRIKYPNDLDSLTQEGQEKEVELCCRFNGSASATKTRATTEERERAIEAVKSFEPANPFCRVVLRPSNVRSGLFLPSKFSAEHLKGVSGFIELQNSDGKQWPVCCVYNKLRAWLGQGWYKFTLENNLNEGDVCVFEVLRLKDIVLKVTVFRVLSFVSALGSNKCRKCIASLKSPLKHDYVTRNKRCKLEVEKKTDVVGDVSDLRQIAYGVLIHSSDEKGKTKHSEHEFYALLNNMGMSLTRNFRNVAAEAKERAVNVARKLKPTNPSFMVVLQSRSMDKAFLYVPIKFASKYLSRDAKIIKLQVSNGREWPVQLCWRQNGCVDLTEGLTEFLKENNLKKGDMCLFELIRTDDFLLKVYFIQCSVNLID